MNKYVQILRFVLLLGQSISAFGYTDTTSISKQDSTKTIHSRSVYIATNFQQLINYRDDTNFSFDLTSRINLHRNKSALAYRSKQELNIELSFTKFIDSIVDVREDEMEIKSNWEFRIRNYLNSINFSIKTQMTNDYDYTFIKGDFLKLLSKQPFLPAIFNLGTGFNLKLKNESFVNFSPVDFKVTLISDEITPFYPDYFVLGSNLFYLAEIGTSITVSINRSGARKLFSWRNNSRIFIKGLTKDGTTIYLKNRIMYEIMKAVNISFESQVVYDPIYNYKLQIRNDIILGISFRK
jgi:hypothetical protein